MPAALAFYEGFLDAKPRGADIALLGCLDRFFLCVCILGRRDLIHPWLYDRCREVEAEPDGYLDLWAREHGKSSLITCAGVIQEILIDPELTVAIFSGTQKSARKFLHQIKREFESNALLRAAYSDVVWDKPKQEAPRWGLDGIVLRRQSNPKEGTVEAWGLIDGMPTGGHYGLLIYDDIVTIETVRNPEMVRKATESWEMSDNLGAGNVRKQHIGTRYSFGDSWGQILERGILKPRIYPGSDDGTIVQGLWPAALIDIAPAIERGPRDAEFLQCAFDRQGRLPDQPDNLGFLGCGVSQCATTLNARPLWAKQVHRWQMLLLSAAFRVGNIRYRPACRIFHSRLSPA